MFQVSGGRRGRGRRERGRDWGQIPHSSVKLSWLGNGQSHPNNRNSS